MYTYELTSKVIFIDKLCKTMGLHIKLFKLNRFVSPVKIKRLVSRKRTELVDFSQLKLVDWGVFRLSAV